MSKKLFFCFLGALLTAALAFGGWDAYLFRGSRGTLLYCPADYGSRSRSVDLTLADANSSSSAVYQKSGYTEVCYDLSRPGWVLTCDGSRIKTMPLRSPGMSGVLNENREITLYPGETSPSPPIQGEIIQSESITSDETQAVTISDYAISRPRLSPNGQNLCFVRGATLYLYQKEGGETPLFSEEDIGSLDWDSTDWLDDTSLLLEQYTHTSQTDFITSLVRYDIETGVCTTLVEQACFPSISYNRDFLAYRLQNDTSTACVRNLKTGETRQFHDPRLTIQSLKPSPDGNYLAVNAELTPPPGEMSSYRDRRFQIIHLDSGRRKRIWQPILYGLLDWQ